MKKQSYISSALSIFIIGLVLVLSVFGKQLTYHQSVKQVSKSEKKENQSSQTTISEVSLEVLVPSHAFDFNDAIFVFATQQIAIIAKNNVFQLITKPIFRLSFFEKLFELHIAINAP